MATDVKVVGNTVAELLAMGRTADAIDALIASGHGYHVSIGAFSTPITGGGAGTVLDLDQPEGVLSVGSGMALIPVSVRVQCQVPQLAADDDECEILVAVDRANGWKGDGTFTAETVFNQRTDLGGTPHGVVAAASAFTADMLAVGDADPVLDLELARRVIRGDSQTAAGVWWGDLDLVYEPKHPPIIVAGATGAALYVYWGGTVALPGFAQLDVVAFPSGWVKNLA